MRKCRDAKGAGGYSNTFEIDEEAGSAAAAEAALNSEEDIAEDVIGEVSGNASISEEVEAARGSSLRAYADVC